MMGINLTAAAILAIPETQPERLFIAPDAAKDEYRQLAKHWHPDLNKTPDAAAVTAHINRLFAAAEEKIAAGQWETPGVLTLIGADGKKRNIRYRKRHDFELGRLYYGDTIIAWLVRSEFADLFENARKRITKFPFSNDSVRQQMARFLPKLKATFETKDGWCVMVMEKTKDVFLLRDVVDAVGGRLDPRHAAWVHSTLHNMLCYLDLEGVTHNAISPDTYFVSPLLHSGMLYGGWWYSADVGARLNALPPRSRSIAPRTMLAEKRAGHGLDRLLIRATTREIMGDITGMNLAGFAPQPMIDFLRRPSTGDAMADYDAWHDKVLKASFGARRFVELPLTASDIFKE